MSTVCSRRRWIWRFLVEMVALGVEWNEDAGQYEYSTYMTIPPGRSLSSSLSGFLVAFVSVL